MSPHVHTVNDEQFEEEVIQGKGLILVDFWAEWCSPCKAFSPVLEEVAAEYVDKVTIMKLNVDENNETTEKFDVRGIPTIILFKNGEIVARERGSLTKSQLAEFLDKNLQ